MKTCVFKGIGFVIALGVCTIGTNSFANAKQSDVYWNSNMVVYGADTSNNLPGEHSAIGSENNKKVILEYIGKFIDAKIKQISKTGKLPFNIVEKGSGGGQNFNFEGVKNDTSLKVLIPVVMTDSYSVDRIGEHYKYYIRTMINLMFCEFSKGDADKSGIHVVYSIPLMTYAMPGSGMELTRELTSAEIAKQYLYNAQNIIMSDLEFPSHIEKYLSDRKTMRGVTYQVTKVTLPKNDKLQSCLGACQKAIADNFTAAYAKKNRNYVMIPSIYSGVKWQKEVAMKINSFSNGSEKEITFKEESSNIIEINVTDYVVDENVKKKNAASSYFVDTGIFITLHSQSGLRKRERNEELKKDKPYQYKNVLKYYLGDKQEYQYCLDDYVTQLGDAATLLVFRK